MNLSAQLLLATFSLSAFYPSEAAALFHDRYGPEYQTCAALPTEELIECIKRLTRNWEVRMNFAFDELRNKLPPYRVELLDTAQKQWEQFRDTNCAFFHSQDGSIRKIELAECQRSMAASRALELESHLMNK